MRTGSETARWLLIWCSFIKRTKWCSFFPKLFESIVLRLSSVYIINSERCLTVCIVFVRKPERHSCRSSSAPRNPIRTAEQTGVISQDPGTHASVSLHLMKRIGENSSVCYLCALRLICWLFFVGEKTRALREWSIEANFYLGGSAV